MEEERELELSAEALAEKERELAEKERELKEKESVLKKAEDRISKMKHNMYDRIDVSLGTMNKVVGGLSIVLVIAIVAGIILS